MLIFLNATEISFRKIYRVNNPKLFLSHGQSSWKQQRDYTEGSFSPRLYFKYKVFDENGVLTL